MVFVVDVLVTILCILGVAFCLYVAQRSKKRGWVKLHAGYGATRIVKRSEDPNWFAFGIWQQYIGVMFCIGLAASRLLKYAQ